MSSTGPKLQKPAPPFSGIAVIDNNFVNINLKDYLGQYVVLFFYPLDFTFVCPTEIAGFSDRLNDFKKINTTVIAVSTDSQYCHLAWKNLPRTEGGIGEIKIPLLSDKSLKISRDYGVLDEATGIPFRGLFIIDANGILRQITVNDLPVGRSVDETLRLVQAFQYTDKHGEVCPVGWSPGQKTIVPNPKDTKNDPSAQKYKIVDAGEQFIIKLYTTEKFSSLDELRGRIYVRTLARQAVTASFELATLPPTSAACEQHSLRTYLQVQEWHDNPLCPTDWGWNTSGQSLVPITTHLAPAPEDLLHMISCPCKADCGVLCSCRNAGLSCSMMCAHCRGRSCYNVSSTEEDEEEEEGDVQGVVEWQVY